MHNSCLTKPQACAEHRLDSVPISIRPGFAVCVVLASHGYPGSYEKGKAIVVEDVPSSLLPILDAFLKINLTIGQTSWSSMLEQPNPMVRSSLLEDAS
jgi:hypothetical protein